ncbi:N-acetylmuramoyl-L-alanine amidase [Clostridium oryzae]|uniref:Beta-N-acetylglucosaminidase n=1 Tax=Clostridium oryzae TaxID=1450648 RepID=A0A1V4IP37_9CLOT|nr:N-acetylmuramoyl-L-alanine amidase [Clostridium oryzae]OPJ61639.1 beta-N-acetylglucosaminidase precursor [Clostridium oryzae]
MRKYFRFLILFVTLLYMCMVNVNNVQAASLPMRMYLDSVKSNMKVHGSTLTVKGWALSSNGISKVKIYMDGNYKGKATYGKIRNDVKKVYTKYKNADKSGYTYTLPLSSYKSGKHKIVVQAVDKKNKTYSIVRYFTVIKSIPIGGIEKPKSNSKVSDSKFTVSGWAISKFGIKNIKVYLDDKYKKSASTSITRKDIAKKYSSYSLKYAAKSGYSCSIDTYTTAPGKHTLKIIITGNDGGTKTYKKTIYISKKSSVMSIESPKASQTFNGSIAKITGWALNDSGVREVQVSVSGKYQGKASIGISRTDVGKKYKGYRYGDKSGFSYSLKIGSLSIGKHKITVKVLGYDGTSQSKSVTIAKKSVTAKKSYDTTLRNFVDKEYNKGGNVYGNTSTAATRSQIKYYMSPGNFSGSTSGKFMFLKLSYVSGISVYDLNTILKGKGVLSGKGEAFLEGGKKYNVNPIYLVSHAFLETGYGTSQLSNGSLKVNGKKTYNMYGIGATDGKANKAGSERAYKEGWFTVDKAIIGGAKFIGANYINNKSTPQDTLYKMRWNYYNMAHQYATDVRWASNQVGNIKKLVDMTSKSAFAYEIPKYKTAKTPVVTLDPAYGGTETGASANGLVEKNVTKDVAAMVGSILKKQSVKVIYTRTNDKTVSSEDRITISNNAGADYFVSLQAHDKYTYYYPSSTNKLGNAIAEAINAVINELKVSTNLTKSNKTIATLAKTTSTSVIVNVGNIKKSKQASSLKSSDYKKKLAQQIANQILDFVY